MQSQSIKILTKAEAHEGQAFIARQNVRATASSPKSQRIPALDFTKGTLVLIMVLYHWINYFVGPQWGYYEYLRFLTPSFIFISGFIISNVYLSKYADSRLSKRLFTRGLKLISIFLVLNAGRIAIVPLLGTGGLVKNALALPSVLAVFVTGNLPETGDKLAAFTILVPISYLLMFSGALILPYRVYTRTFFFVCLFLILSVSILGLIGAESAYLELDTIGMLGVLAGFIPIARINKAVRHPFTLTFLYLCYLIAITAWNVPFPLLIVGVALSVMVIYLLGSSGKELGPVRNEVILLGKYSLFGYISQISILQILAAGFHRAHLGGGALVISFFAAFALTIASVEILDRARARTPSVDRVYKAVFA